MGRRRLLGLLVLAVGCAGGAPPSEAPTSAAEDDRTAREGPASIPSRPAPSEPARSAAPTPDEPPAPPQASASAQPPRPVASSGGCGFGFLDGDECYGGLPAEPDVVARDVAEIERSFSKLSPVPAAGPLAQATLGRVLPAAFRTEYQEELERLDCKGGHLDDEGKWFLLQVSYGGTDAALVVLDERGHASFKLRVPNRMQVYLRNVLGDETQEVILSRIEENWLSRWPTTWVIYRVDARGRLRRVLEHPKSHSYGSKQREWLFLNRFDFTVHDQVTVETVLSIRLPGEPVGANADYIRDAPMQGEKTTFVYDPAQGRFRRKRQ